MVALTEAEGRVIHALVDAWNAYLQLPVDHQDAQGEFRQGIHALQAMVFARPAVKAWNAAHALAAEPATITGLGKRIPPAPASAIAPDDPRCATSCGDPRWCTDAKACWRTNEWRDGAFRPRTAPPG